MTDINACNKDTFIKIKDLVLKACRIIRVSGSDLSSDSDMKINNAIGQILQQKGGLFFKSLKNPFGKEQKCKGDKIVESLKKYIIYCLISEAIKIYPIGNKCYLDNLEGIKKLREAGTDEALSKACNFSIDQQNDLKTICHQLLVYLEDKNLSDKPLENNKRFKKIDFSLEEEQGHITVYTVQYDDNGMSVNTQLNNENSKKLGVQEHGIQKIYIKHLQSAGRRKTIRKRNSRKRNIRRSRMNLRRSRINLRRKSRKSKSKRYSKKNIRRRRSLRRR